MDIVPSIKAATLVSAFVLGLGALAVATPSFPAPTASACDAPDLGFGAGEGKNTGEMPPTVGTLRIAMLFVDFADAPGPVEPQSIYDAHDVGVHRRLDGRPPAGVPGPRTAATGQTHQRFTRVVRVARARIGASKRSAPVDDAGSGRRASVRNPR